MNPGDQGSHGPAESTSLTLIERVKARDADAWTRLSAIYGPTVYGWARRHGLREEDARDVTQEVFLAVAQHVGSFRRDRPGDSFRGWLWTITHNKVRDHFRRQAAEPQAAGGTAMHQLFEQLPEVIDDSSSGSGPDDMTRVARRALNVVRIEIEDRTFQAFVQVVMERRPPAEVAAELGMGIWAVYQAKSRVLRRLRRELEGLIG